MKMTKIKHVSLIAGAQAIGELETGERDHGVEPLYLAVLDVYVTAVLSKTLRSFCRPPTHCASPVLTLCHPVLSQLDPNPALAPQNQVQSLRKNFI